MEISNNQWPFNPYSWIHFRTAFSFLIGTVLFLTSLCLCGSSIDPSQFFHSSRQSVTWLWASPPKLHVHSVHLQLPFTSECRCYFLHHLEWRIWNSNKRLWMSPADDLQQLQVKIPHPGPLSSSLGSSISIPCSVILSSSPAPSLSSPFEPRIKWSVVSGGIETQILVAKGHMIKVNEAYRERAVRLNYTSSPYAAALWLGDLRSSDSGYYRCEVMHGLEDSSDAIELKVKGKMKWKRQTVNFACRIYCRKRL